MITSSNIVLTPAHYDILRRAARMGKQFLDSDDIPVLMDALDALDEVSTYCPPNEFNYDDHPMYDDGYCVWWGVEIYNSDVKTFVEYAETHSKIELIKLIWNKYNYRLSLPQVREFIKERILP